MKGAQYRRLCVTTCRRLGIEKGYLLSEVACVLVLIVRQETSVTFLRVRSERHKQKTAMRTVSELLKAVFAHIFTGLNSLVPTQFRPCLFTCQ